MRPDAVRGHLDGLILAVLEERSPARLRDHRGAAGAQRRALDLPTGTVYPALRRLERAALLSGSWSTVGGRERRTYTLTRAGRHALAGQRAEWTEFSAVVDAVLRPAAGAS